MSRDPVAVEHHIRRLDGEELAAFVADLWAARGFETRREGGVVVATVGGRTRRLAVRGLVADPSDRRVDAVIAPRGRAGERRHVANGDDGTADHAPDDPRAPRLVDAADLREMLWYAVEPERAAALCERHFGAPPDRLTPPLGVRLRHRIRLLSGALPALRRPGGDRSREGSPPVARVPAVVAVLAVLALVGAVAGAGVVDDGRVRGGGTPTTDPTPAAVPTGGEPPVFPGLAQVPGVDATGVTDPGALAAAHDRALDERYTLWIDVYRPAGGTPNATVQQRDIDVAVAGDRYLLEATLKRDRGDRPLLTVYDDGRRRYVSDYRNGTVERRALPPNASSPATVPPPAVLRRTLVTRYLTSPETNVSGIVEEDGREYYRIVATGAPGGDLGNVDEYTAVALIDDRGLVADLEVRYVRPTAAGRLPIRVEATYDPTRRARVGPPAWYDAVAGNRTAGAAGSGGH